MKTKFFIIAAIFTLGLTSCKKDEKGKEAEGTAPAAVTKDKFSVELDVIAPKEDNFSMYYTEDGTNNFTGEKAVWSGVKGQADSQKITFDLSEEIIPTDIRLDFGMNKDQGDVTLKNLKMSYYGKSFEIKGSDFFKYFLVNDSVKTEIDPANGTVKFLKNPKKYFTPFYYPNKPILDEIKKITN